MCSPSKRAKARRAAYHNSEAAHWNFEASSVDKATIARFHQKLPGFSQTPLHPLPALAAELGVKAVYLKDESSRCELPAFKILGASWAAFRAIAEKFGLSLDAGLEVVAAAAQAAGVELFAATDGNHGRAIARFAKLLGIPASISVPVQLDAPTVDAIRAEGCEVLLVDGDYDEAVLQARRGAEQRNGGLWIQDTAFDDYREIPQWVVDGYGTMLLEVDEQLQGICPDLVVAPVGVGSFAQAVTCHSKASGRSTRVMTVEPDAAPCLWNNLRAQELKPIDTSKTIMSGMNCGTVSSISFPILQSGVDVSLTVSDKEAHDAVLYLATKGISAGPCGAAPLAALRQVVQFEPSRLELDSSSVVVLFCTEGSRDYIIPKDVSIEDPALLTQALVRIDSSNPGLSQGLGAGETEIADYITAWLSHRDIEIHRLEKSPGRPSVVGVVRGTGGGKSLMLNGHIDTVTNAGYNGDPLSGMIQDGSIYGRGVFDMKAGIAASMIALSEAKNAKLRGDVILAAVADEENLSAGTEELLAAGWRADAVIVSEPTFLDVTLAHKGFLWLEVDVLGKAAHGSRPEFGIDAICKAGHFLAALDIHSQDILRGAEHPVLGTGSIHASLITGGEEPSSYPAKCTITVERRTVPGETLSTVEAEIRKILDGVKTAVSDFDYELRMGMSRPPFEVSPADPFVLNVLKHVDAALQRPATQRPEKFWTDCALFAEQGIPAVLFGVDGGGAHAATEWTTLDSLEKVTKALVSTVLDFCS